MFAVRQIVTLSTFSVVLLGSGMGAIAQTAPVNPTSEESPEGQVLLSSLGHLSPDLHQVPAAPAEVAVNPSLDPQFLTNVGSLATPKTALVTPVTTTPDLLASAGVLTAPQPALNSPSVSLPNGQSQHLGAIAAPTPAITLANVPVETAPIPQLETLPDTAASNIPVVKPLPPEQVTNPELQTLIAPLLNPAVTVPSASAEVTTADVPLTLEETIRLALERNEELQEARLNLERTKYQLREAIAADYPTLSNQIDLTRSETTGGELSAERVGIDESTADSAINHRLELSYDIYTGGRRSAQIDAAATQLKINELDVERLTEVTRLNAATTYYDLQSADSQIFIEAAAVQNAQQSLDDADLLEKAGLGTKFDVLRAQVDLANAQQRLTRAEAAQKIARRQLAQLLSLEAKANPTAADEIAIAGKWEMPLEDTIVLALQQRQELRQQLLLREIDGYQQEIALANIRPQVSIFANYDVLDVFKDNLDMADGVTLGARMRWNIFDGGAAAARVDQEQVDKAIAENRFISQRNQIRLAVENAYYNLEASEANIKTAGAAVELADESLRLARMRFKAGVGTQTDVIAAQTELTTARGNYLQAVTDYNRAFVQLKREVGLGDAVISD